MREDLREIWPLVRLTVLLVAFALGCALAILFALPVQRAHARDLDGHWAAADPDKHAWFDSLKSGRGLCCSFVDGSQVDDADWDTLGKADDVNSGYRVRLGGVWLDVPSAAMVTVPNKYGQAVVWPYNDSDGNQQIRCFLPGAGA